jgi:hypothetical protein
MSPQPRDDVGIDHEGRKRLGGLKASQQLAQRVCQSGRATRIGRERLRLDEIHHRNAGVLIHVVNTRRDAGFGRDAHRGILMGIA